jgi:hypothetical protein
MIKAIDNGELLSDLDCQSNNILNVNELVPVPLNLVPIDDSRLSDARVPLDGSVTDASVAAGAGIVQSKIDFDGQIPSAWLGTSATTAAQGNLAEYKSNKNVPGGYAGLDATGKVPVAFLPADVGTGTVTSLGLVMPSGEFDVTGSPVTTSGTITSAWKPQAANAWFGNPTALSAVPVFSTTPLPPALIPALDASKITTGIIDPARLPIAVGMGASHSAGAVPDPGDGSVGAPTDYLARDMSYQPVPVTGALTYQPTVPDPVITQSALVDGSGNYVYTITMSLPGVALFFSVGVSAPGTFSETTPGSSVSVPPGSQIWVYGSKAGYNNSTMVSAP